MIYNTHDENVIVVTRVTNQKTLNSLIVSESVVLS